MVTFVALVSATSSGVLAQDLDAAVHDEVAVETPSPQDKQFRLAAFISKTWRVNTAHALTVVRAAFEAATRFQVDPIIILAIAAKESSFRHVGKNPNHTYGIMQVIGRYHMDKFEDGRVRATSVTENIHLGAHVMREALDRERGDLPRALMRYNGSPNKASYSRAVLRLRELIAGAVYPQEN